LFLIRFDVHSMTQFPRLLSLSFLQTGRQAAACYRPDSQTKFGLPHYLLGQLRLPVVYISFFSRDENRISFSLC